MQAITSKEEPVKHWNETMQIMDSEEETNHAH